MDDTLYLYEQHTYSIVSPAAVLVVVEKYYGCCVVQVKRTSLVDSRTAVNDVKFAPRHLGLQLVSASHTWCIYTTSGFVCFG